MVLGDEAVNDVGEGGDGVGVEFGNAGKAVPERVVGGVEGSAGMSSNTR